MTFDDRFLPWKDRRNIELPAQGEWSYLLDRLEEEFPHSLYSLSLAIDGNILVAKGAVGSLGAKALLIRMLDDHPLVHIIDNRIEVTAPFRPASTGADPFEHLEAMIGIEDEGEEAASGGESIVRYPSIQPIGEAKPDELLAIKVDLGLEPDELTQGDATTIDDAPEGWTELDVEVRLHSPHLTFRNGAEIGQITLRNGKPSLAAVMSALVDASAADRNDIQVNAEFYHGDRKCGWATRLIALAGRMVAKGKDEDAAAESTEPKKSVSGASPGVHIDVGAAAAELTINIYKQHGAAEGAYFWTWRSISGTGIGARSSGTIDLRGNTEDFSRDLLTRCAKLKPGNHAMTLAGIGTDIWDVTPPEFKEHYLGLREMRGDKFPIQIFTDEPHVPWEMMFPTPDSRGASDHLFMTHPIARWFVSHDNVVPKQFSGGGITSFVPEYSSDELPGAAAEGQWLKDTFSTTIGVVTGETSFKGFTSFFCNPLPDAPVGIIHFAGHGDGAHGQSRGLKMTDDWVAADALKHHGVSLGRRDKALVIINACEVGTTDFKLGVVDGWPMVMVKAGFAGVLSPIWAVQDDHASVVIKGAIPPFIAGTVPLASALTSARHDNRNLSPAPYAYLFYGDVMALRPASP